MDSDEKKSSHFNQLIKTDQQVAITIQLLINKEVSNKRKEENAHRPQFAHIYAYAHIDTVTVKIRCEKC